MPQPRQVSETFSWLFDPRMPLLFVLGGLLLAIIGNAAYDLLLLWWGTGFWALLGALLLSLLLLVLVVLGIQAVLRARRPAPIILGPEEEAEPRPGLVLFLSKGEGKADELALEFHADHLRHVWFIVTAEVEEKCGRLAQFYRKKGSNVTHLSLNRPQDAGESYDLVQQALAEAGSLGMGPGSLYVDITGCLRPSAVGAAQACLEAGHDIEYVLARYDEEGRVIKETSKVMKVAVLQGGEKTGG